MFMTLSNPASCLRCSPVHWIFIVSAYESRLGGNTFLLSCGMQEVLYSDADLFLQHQPGCFLILKYSLPCKPVYCLQVQIHSTLWTGRIQLNSCSKYQITSIQVPDKCFVPAQNLMNQASPVHISLSTLAFNLPLEWLIKLYTQHSSAFLAQSYNSSTFLHPLPPCKSLKA